MVNKPGWRRTPLWGYWDNRTPLNNPHKGWYLHYYDNGLKVYFDKEHPEDYLEDFPCLGHIYLRLAWAYLEPEEGRYNWELLDEVIRRWWPRGRQISFRITCKETDPDQAYATPEWVVKAGCKGEFIGPCFEPDYGDPVFLEKFGNFMQAFGGRYDGAPFVEFVDIGSFGEWGECHTEGFSDRTWPVEVMKEHIDIHTRAFKKTRLVANYDIIALRRAYDGTEQELLDYILRAGCGVRADSCCVGFYENRYGLSSMHLPAVFQRFYGKGPMDLEFGHYGGVKKTAAWNNGFPGLASAYETHATYAGFHGYAREFLADHPHYAVTLGNLLGYWYFVQAAFLPESIRAGQRGSMGLIWENRGVSPCFYRYALYLKLRCNETGQTDYLPLREADNREWMPTEESHEIYSIRPRADLPPGSYTASIGLFEANPSCENLPSGYEMPTPYPFPGRPIRLALSRLLLDEEGFYRMGDVRVDPCEYPPYEGVVKMPFLWPEFPDNPER